MQNITYGSTGMDILLTANGRTRIVIIEQTQWSCNISRLLRKSRQIVIIETNTKNGVFSKYRTRELCKINPLEIGRIYEIGKMIKPFDMGKQEGERER